jgi:ankyrin repeat protein
LKDHHLKSGSLIKDYSGLQGSTEGNQEEDNDYTTNQEKLWSAIETRASIKTIIELLNKDDVSVDAKNIFDDGWTALHYAVHEGYFEVVKLLIENFGSTVESRSSTNKTPFHLACIRGEEKLLKFMIQRGSNGASVDRDGSTPLHYLCETENHDMIKFLLPMSDGSKDIRNRFGKKPVDLV